MENNKLRISYLQKDAIKCPVCSYEFHREEMLTGGGRLIAGNLTDELRRNYEESKKYGLIYPLAYIITVCPKCLYAAYPKDFNDLSNEEIEKIKNSYQLRNNTLQKFLGNIDFHKSRDLILGAASFLLVVEVYSVRTKKIAPTFKKAVSALRAAWLFNDLNKMYPDKPYNKISQFFYKKSYLFYEQVIELVQNGKEPIEAAGNMGPDIDKNWGYDGILYLYAVLTMKIGDQEKDIEKRIKSFEKTKRYLSRVFGMGKASKSKPGAIIEMIKDLYETMGEKLNKWYEEQGKLNSEE